jgi:hypothetical protein
MFMLKKNTMYQNIYFSGSGFLNIFQLGVVRCLLDNNIYCQHCYSTSAGFAPALALLMKNDDFFEFVVISNLKANELSLFDTTNYGKTTLAENISLFTKLCTDNFDLSEIYSRLHLGAKNIFLQNVWFSDFTDKDDFSKAILSSTRLLPFVSYIPHQNYYIDQIIVLNIKDIIFDLCVTPFESSIDCLLPSSFCYIFGKNDTSSLQNILYPSYNIMIREFIYGYLVAKSKIKDSVDNNIIDYVVHINDKFKNWEYDQQMLDHLNNNK